jgi:hypothetical protein
MMGVAWRPSQCMWLSPGCQRGAPTSSSPRDELLTVPLLLLSSRAPRHAHRCGASTAARTLRACSTVALSLSTVIDWCVRISSRVVDCSRSSPVLGVAWSVAMLC